VDNLDENAQSTFSEAFARIKADDSDQRAWEVFIKAMSPTLLYHLYHMSGGNKELARDVLQDVFIRFVEQMRLKKVDNAEAVLPLLRTMARNRLIDYFRYSNARPTASLEDFDSFESSSPGESAATVQELRHEELARLAQHLSNDDQDLLARLLRGTDLQLIAKSLQISYSSAAVRLFRLKKRLGELADAN